MKNERNNNNHQECKNRDRGRKSQYAPEEKNEGGVSLRKIT